MFSVSRRPSWVAGLANKKAPGLVSGGAWV